VGEQKTGSSGSLKEGDYAPDFTFQVNDSSTMKLSEFRKTKNIVLYFYPKDFTVGCTTEASEFGSNYETFTNSDIEIIGVSPDDQESHEGFRKEMEIPYILVSDTENEISKKYGVYGTKKFMGKEYLGIRRSTFLIDKKGRIIKIFYNVRPRGHSKEVLSVFGK
jgi:peroxiredoxin Q/BCP